MTWRIQTVIKTKFKKKNYKKGAEQTKLEEGSATMYLQVSSCDRSHPPCILCSHRKTERKPT